MVGTWLLIWARGLARDEDCLGCFLWVISEAVLFYYGLMVVLSS